MAFARATSALCASLLAATLVASGSAAASQRHGTTSIDAHVSDPTPAAGQTFVVRGHYTLAGHPAAGHAVKVQTYVDSAWQNITGARVEARADGGYRVRVILAIPGVRFLRVVGVAGGERRNSYDRFVVEVH